jgi:hypothetical protein
MKKQAFVPTPDHLESRIALSGGPKFINGAAVLTGHAMGQTYSMIQKAFTKFAAHGQNYNQLQGDLAKAVNRIPYNRRDGLLAAVQFEAWQMTNDIQSRVPFPVKSALQRALSDVNDFVQGEMAAGAMVVR